MTLLFAHAIFSHMQMFHTMLCMQKFWWLYRFCSLVVSWTIFGRSLALWIKFTQYLSFWGEIRKYVQPFAIVVLRKCSKTLFLLKKNLWISDPSTGILEEFQCRSALRNIKYNCAKLFLGQMFSLIISASKSVSQRQPLENAECIFWSQVAKMKFSNRISNRIQIKNLLKYLKLAKKCKNLLFCNVEVYNYTLFVHIYRSVEINT